MPSRLQITTRASLKLRFRCRRSRMIILKRHLRWRARVIHALLVTMNNQNNPAREVREKIVSLMQSIGQAPRKQITGEELQRLKIAATRLDEMLKAGTQADLQALKSAAARLDQLLSDIRGGKDISLKRR